jgi:predicted transcriptional regulator
MERSLEAIQFLAGSANRVAVLSALSHGRATRRDLQEKVDGSRSTVARLLSEAEVRAWVDSEGSRYWLTPLGETMVEGFQSYVETVEGVQHLGEMVNHVPPPLRSIDFRELRDAEIIEPSASDPAAPFTRAYELFQRAVTFRGLQHTAFPHFVRLLRDGLADGRLEDSEAIIEAAFLETVRANPERRALWASFVDLERGRTLVYDGTVPVSFHIINERAVVWLGETREAVAGLLVSENPAVLRWGESLYEEYRSKSEPLDEL